MSYLKELEDGMQRLQSELASAKNDTRLSQGVYDLAKFNITNLEVELAELRTRLAAKTTESNQRWEQLCQTMAALGKLVPETVPYSVGHAKEIREALVSKTAEVETLRKDLQWRTEIKALTVAKDGNAWFAVRPDFINLQESEAWFGATPAGVITAALAQTEGKTP